jgi:hypothetical protein
MEGNNEKGFSNENAGARQPIRNGCISLFDLLAYQT